MGVVSILEDVLKRLTPTQAAALLLAIVLLVFLAFLYSFGARGAPADDPARMIVGAVLDWLKVIVGVAIGSGVSDARRQESPAASTRAGEAP
jgi:hypothetical protein